MSPKTFKPLPSDHGPCDRQLLAGCLAGRRFDQETFIRRFSNLTYATIQGVARSKSTVFEEQDLDDLHNTVFMLLFDKGCRKLRQYQGKNGCSLASWVRMVTVRTVLDHLRRRKDALAYGERMVVIEDLPELGDEGESALGRLEENEQAELIASALQLLPIRDQLLLRYHYYEEQPLDKIRVILNISASNIHSVKHRAVKRLKAAVADCMRE